MSDPIGDFRIGEDIAIALDAVTGDPATVTAITAKMRPAKPISGHFDFIDGGAAVVMTVTARAAAGGIPAGWNLVLSAAQSASLAAGFYGIDARLVIGSGVEITDQTAFIRVSAAAVP